MIFSRAQAKRRLFAPEIVQVSSMDCGPAALKCICEGFGIPVSYGRLREACQTDVDGTSIDTMEEVAAPLGLEAEQIMVPTDHLLLPGTQTLPAIVVVQRAGGATHFIVAWRRHGNLIQIMDPAVGRLWLTSKQFLEQIYVHTVPVAAAAWREWAQSDEFLGALRQRLAHVGVTGSTAKRLIKSALADPGWRPIAALDAAARMVNMIVRAGGIDRGRQASRVIERFAALAQEESQDGLKSIPAEYWTAFAASPDSDGEEQVLLRGAVLVRVSGPLIAEPAHIPEEPTSQPGEPPDLSPEIAAALEEPSSRMGQQLFRLLGADGFLMPMILIVALLFAAGGVVVEALLLSGLFDIGADLNLAGQRLGAMGTLLIFMVGLLLLELPIVAGVLRLGRRFETRLRTAFLKKLPRLNDRYFHSRPTSDMAERSHSIHRARQLPELAERFMRLCFELLLITAGIIWLDPSSAPIAMLAAALAVGLPLVAQPVLMERDLRVRNHNGALSHFYLDALIGLVAVRTHGAERALRREHESLLIKWASASLGRQRAVLAVEGLQFFVGFGLAAWLLLGFVTRHGESGALLLFVYWVLNLPVLGQEIAMLAQQYPDYRNVMLRLLEPLGAPEAVDHPPVSAESVATNAVTHHALAKSKCGCVIDLQAVSVQAAGHLILEDIDLRIEPASHVAIVGASGAGKSSLVGLLLGWHRAAAGQVLVDGAPLNPERLARLRRETAWVDPGVQLWNRSFLANLHYGAGDEQALAVGQVIKSADLIEVLQKLPDGLQTPLGEAGGLVSGGEGQRMRLGRAMLRQNVRLVILDEPFRGLERTRRHVLLARVRELWPDATLICISHDLEETRAFPRVVVIDQGRIVEDGDPNQLASQAESRYQELLKAEEDVRTGLWSSDKWRRLRLKQKRLVEDAVQAERHV